MTQDNGGGIGKDFTNLYSVTKTVRFGMTPNKSKISNINQFSELVNESLDKIEKELTNRRQKSYFDEKQLIQTINDITIEITKQIDDWSNLKHRGDALMISKEYYEKLAYKGRFRAFETQIKTNTKKQKKESVKVPTLKNDYLGLNYLGKDKNNDRKKIIISLWDSNISRLENLYIQIKYPLEQYLKASNDQNKAHTKPNLIEFKKLILGFCNITKLILEPIYTRQIVIEKLDKLPKSEENFLLKVFFAHENLDRINKLIEKIAGIQDYYKANGALVPFGKVSLNYYTSLQKPENYKDKIKELIEKLELGKILDKYKSIEQAELINILKFDINHKISTFLYRNSDLTLLEQAQLFKPKPIPFGIKSKLVDYFAKDEKYKNAEIRMILDSFGQSVDIAKDFEKLENKNELNLNAYPIKLAFDYSWENVARNITGLIPDNEFARSQSLEFLEQFGVSKENENFILYADLLFVADKLAVLEHQSHEIRNQIEIDNIVGAIDEKLKTLTNPFKDSKDKKFAEFENYLNQIYEALDNPKGLKKDDRFQKAKQEIGLVRGGVKNEIDKYPKITKKFKEIAPELGRNFADLREKFKEQDEQTKIGFYGVILEEKYLLIIPLVSGSSRDIIESQLKTDKNESDFKVIKVVSLTSKALKKIEHSKVGYPDFHHEKKGDEVYDKGETNQVVKDKTKLLYLKSCVLESEMAKEQDWSEIFGWTKEVENAYSRKELDKILDIKGHKMTTMHISKESVDDLVKNKGCYLLPLISQDSLGNKDEFLGNINRFTSDFELALSRKKGYRVHPEISLFYQFPTDLITAENHHAGILNRNSRFQLKANLGIEIIKSNTKEGENITLTKKEQNLFMKDKEEYNKHVQEFNKKINEKYLKTAYRYGIDRGINEIATLCVLDTSNNIQDFLVFKKERKAGAPQGRLGHINPAEKKLFRYTGCETKSILDLTNLKVETWHLKDKNHPNSTYLRNIFNDLEQNKDSLEYKIAKKLGYFDFLNDKDNPKVTILVEYPQDTANNIKLKIKVYEREIQKQFSENRDNIKNIVSQILKDKDLENLNNNDKKLITKQIFGLQTDKTITKLIDPLEGDKPNINRLLNPSNFNTIFQPLVDLLVEIHKSTRINKLEQVGELDNLKKGVISNIVGIVRFLQSKMQGMIVLENTANVRDDESESQLQREQEKWLGADSYRYLEVMLIRKFGKIVNIDQTILNLTPPFLNIESINMQLLVIDSNKVINNYQFGIFYYLPADNTSKICPCCFTNHSNLKKEVKDKFRPRKQQHIFCQNSECQFTTDRSKLSEIEVKSLATIHKNTNVENLLKIQNGDQNASFIITHNFTKSFA
jgi:hypothetical protein